jgi:hypothetical protein
MTLICTMHGAPWKWNHEFHEALGRCSFHDSGCWASRGPSVGVSMPVFIGLADRRSLHLIMFAGVSLSENAGNHWSKGRNPASGAPARTPTKIKIILLSYFYEPAWRVFIFWRGVHVKGWALLRQVYSNHYRVDGMAIEDALN